MSVLYKLVGVWDNLNRAGEKKSGLMARTVSRRNIDTETMLKELSYGSSSKKGELASSLIQITEYIERNLLEGNNVTINGFGTFSVTAECRLVKNKKEIRAESVNFKRVVFKMSAILQRRLKVMTFERYSE